MEKGGGVPVCLIDKNYTSRTVALENYEMFISSHLALLETGVGERQTISFQIKLSRTPPK